MKLPFASLLKVASFSLRNLPSVKLSAVIVLAGMITLAHAVNAQQSHATKTAPAAARETGKQTFVTACAGCHGLDGRGGKHAPNIATRREVLRLSDAKLSGIIRNGNPSGEMPGFGASLDDSQILAVTAYLRTLQGGAGLARLPGDPENGKALFFGKAGCSDCHMVSGQGGFIAADLSAYAATRSSAEIRNAIVDPERNLDPRERTAVVLTRGGESFTGFIRNEDNFSVQLQTLDGALHLFERSGLQSVEYQQKSLMPTDYAQKLSSRDLNDLVSFLMRAASASPASQSAANHARALHKSESLP
jgi:cytochrome c oxidase cbb3-type subunit III